jgi:xylan 1,4-beta-xylosidase
VTLDWDPVDGAVGYLVHRATTADGPYEPVDHGGNDVLAVPHPPYVDTSGERARAYWYAVAALAEASHMGPLSDPVSATAAPDAGASVRVDVTADRVIGRLDRPGAR